MTVIPVIRYLSVTIFGISFTLLHLCSHALYFGAGVKIRKVMSGCQYKLKQVGLHNTQEIAFFLLLSKTCKLMKLALSPWRP